MSKEQLDSMPSCDLEAVGLTLAPTEAMKQGAQVVHQCSRCGCVVAYRTALGLCPACGRDASGNETGRSNWRGERLPIAGLIQNKARQATHHTK